MSGPHQDPPAFHLPADVAALLRCSTWWVKEQARRRRIPYCWIGGGYRFTDEHLVEIARICEVRPIAETLSARTSAAGTPRKTWRRRRCRTTSTTSRNTYCRPLRTTRWRTSVARPLAPGRSGNVRQDTRRRASRPGARRCI